MMGLGLREKDPKFRVHRTFYEKLSQSADVALIENVPEYDLKKKVEEHLGWPSVECRVDPQNFGFACARPRVYGLTWNPKKVVWNSDLSLMDILTSLMAKPQMVSEDYWFLTKQPSPLSPALES